MPISFDFLSQLQGPQIDVNLYSNAATQGIAAGKNLPSTTTAIIQGAITGMEKGLDIAGKYQENTIRQNQIEQLPVANRIQAAQARTVEAQADINEMSAEKDVLTQEEDISATRAKLKDETVKAEQDSLLRQKAMNFQKTYETASPQAKRDMLFSGQYNDVFAQFPSIYKQAAFSPQVYPYLSADEQSAVNYYTGKATLLNSLNSRRQQELLSAPVIEDNLRIIDGVRSAAVNTGFPETMIPQKTELVESGKYVTDDKGNIKFDDKAGGKLQITPGWMAGSSKQWALKYGTRIVGDNIDEKEKAWIVKAQNLEKWRNGEYINNVARGYDDSFKTSRQKQQSQGQIQPETTQGLYAPEKAKTNKKTETGVPDSNALAIITKVPVITENGEINVSENPQATQAVKRIIGLSDDDYAEIAPTVKTLLSLAEQEPQGLFGYWPSAEQTRTEIDSVRTISRYTAGKEFDKLPEKGKALYTEKEVKAHNKMVDDFEKDISIPGEAGSLAFFKYSDAELGQMEKVETPRDLYIVKKLDYYQALTRDIYAGFKRYIEDSKRALRKESLRGILYKLKSSGA